MRNERKKLRAFPHSTPNCCGGASHHYRRRGKLKHEKLIRMYTTSLHK